MITNGFMVPHPPIAVPEVGKGEEHKCQPTVDSYLKLADRIAEIRPELILLSSPHAVLYRDWFNISGGKKAYGDLSRFRADVSMEVEYDEEFVKTLEKTVGEFPCGSQYDRDKFLDHATIVPLYYINQRYKDYKLVRISLSGFSLPMHYQLGMYLQKVCNMLNRKAVYIASGDLSHCQPGSSYGEKPEGTVYDQKIMETMSSGRFNELLDYDPLFLEKAMECGHRSFTIMAGAFDGRKVTCEKWSHEAPFGVGYGFAEVKDAGKDPDRHFLTQYEEKEKEKVREEEEKADDLVKLARKSVEAWVTKKEMIQPDQERSEKAGVFVSLHKDHMLRGCIGTINPLQDNISLEIIHNAISACSKDPRFQPVEKEELPYLSISVDVLKKPERIQDKRMLDVKKYGVICSTKDGRRGLLLPDLDGVDTIDQQIEIACSKGGIDPDSDQVILERFEVVRHV